LHLQLAFFEVSCNASFGKRGHPRWLVLGFHTHDFFQKHFFQIKVVYCNSFKMQQYVMKKSENQTIKKFRDILRRFEREIFMQSNESCCSGVTLAQCHTLLEIESENKDTVTELSKKLGLDKSTVSRTIDGLVNSGLVDRTIPAENRRMATLRLTEYGKKICSSINSKNDKYFNDLLSTLTEPEKEELIRLFEKITTQMVNLRSSCSS
jgi:DNA-binding MarR family transcriptional regulator